MILNDQMTTRNDGHATSRRTPAFLKGVPAAVAAVGPLASGAVDLRPCPALAGRSQAPQDASPPALRQGVAEVRRAADRPPLHRRRRRDGAARRGPKPRELRDAAPARHPARHRAGDHVPPVSAGQASARAAPRETPPLRMPRTATVRVTSRLDDLAFEPVTVLSALIRRRRVTSTDLTKMYLARLEKYGETLHCVVTLTADLALAQAAKADRDLKAGRYHGAAARHPVGRQGSLRHQGHQDHMGRDAVRQSGHRCGCDGRRTAARRRRRARRQALDGLARAGRRLVRRHDAKSVERPRPARAARRPVRARRPPRAWSASRSAPKRAAPSSRRPASAASSGCGRPTAA